jgi:hypothetical protein
MRRLVASCLIALALAAPAAAQEEGKSAEDGFSLLEEGAKIILRSFLDEMEPAMKDLKDGMGEAMARMGPALRDLVAKIDDIRNYHPPEVLPNGDIILRRKVPAERAMPAPGGEIEL